MLFRFDRKTPADAGEAPTGAGCISGTDYNSLPDGNYNFRVSAVPAFCQCLSELLTQGTVRPAPQLLWQPSQHSDLWHTVLVPHSDGSFTRCELDGLGTITNHKGGVACEVSAPPAFDALVAWQQLLCAQEYFCHNIDIGA